jgi:hypothetical protein
MKGLAKWVGVGVLVSGTALAASSSVKWSDKESHWTGVSGFTDGETEEAVIGAQGSYGERAVYSFAVQESGDEPCQITMFARGLPQSKAGTGQQSIFALGTSHAAHDSYKKHCNGATKTVRVGEDFFGTAIQVCTNDKSNNRVKGLKLWGASVDANGKLTPNSTPTEFALPNCSKWHTKVSCDTGEVITGVKGVAPTKNGSTEGFSGVSIRCSKVVTTFGASR